ncbi:MAG: protein kinase [Planctomycetota bacterium]
MALVHRIGEPENASETKAIKQLAELLPESYIIFHNFELTTGRGLPYEYDMAVVGDFAIWHVEVKGYRGQIKGTTTQWEFENGAVMPSPIPLANKKSKILSSKLKSFDRNLDKVWVDTVVLLTDDKAKIRIKDDQSGRVIQLKDALDYFTDPKKIPVQVNDISKLHNRICEALFGGAGPRRTVKTIGLYDVLERINQTETRTVFLAKHRYIRTRPKTILKVFHFDIYTSADERERQIHAIFHDQDACRLLGAHPNLMDTSDMFAWDDNKFVLPTEYLENGRPLSVILEQHEDREITWKTKAEIISKMARGLRHAHSKGVIHRDIRPLNVVIAPNGVVKLVNFDLAKIKGSPLDQSDKKLRSRFDKRYAAPEVWEDPEAATERSDIYSLGIVFYELITSKTAYSDIGKVVADEEAEIPYDRDLLLSELSTPGSEDFMASPEDAVAVIERMIKRDPKERYASVDEVIEDLSILKDD